ncbi:cathepsin Llike cysteine protease [Acanthamoeba castellanii str. Neff]|uniref:Cathepsin Llike cysteine protease n=1 Tax=Acanthamoeba castellanii (strain ATCC 30010 / Neff) TaxID=1257118 RepID=L8HGW9_ACACF|nr:cathepsin Llike cysteine protease [Acanthamoeba castellanii str. Neff]ELR24415.1 cathepsin Llike cysteine protease [Acanthamoeba castellanii str. Neff]
MGCGGGLPSQAFQYVIDNKGIDTEARYPLASVWISDCTAPELCPCTYNQSAGAVGAVVASYTSLPAGSEAALAHALATVGPISVCIDAEQGLQFYSGGVFSSRSCGSARTDLNHAVLAVGYGSVPVNGTEVEYYIVKNSWGRSWGMDGYVLFARGSNMCGIATLATYPSVI